MLGLVLQQIPKHRPEQDHHQAGIPHTDHDPDDQVGHKEVTPYGEGALEKAGTEQARLRQGLADVPGDRVAIYVFLGGLDRS